MGLFVGGDLDEISVRWVSEASFDEIVLDEKHFIFEFNFEVPLDRRWPRDARG